METSDPHDPKHPALDTPDELRAEAYESPSIIELGSFLELTSGIGSGEPQDMMGFSTAG